MMKNIFVVVMMVLAVLSTSAFAGTLPIVNAGFENEGLADGDWNLTLPGWELLVPEVDGGQMGAWNPDGSYGALVPNPDNVGFTSDAGLPGVDSGIKQVLAATLVADVEYVLTVSVGNYGYYAWGEGYKVQLLAGGILLNEDDNSIDIATDTFELSTVTWDSTGTALGLIGLPLEIRLIAKAGSEEVDFDNVQLVPEPATMALLGLGGLLLARRKKA